MEDFPEYIFIVMKMLYWDKAAHRIETEQVSLVLGSNFVISFQEEKERDVFNPIRERIRKESTKIRKMGADYLAYSLIDAVVDSYFLILEHIGEWIEDIEEVLVSAPRTETMHAIHGLKKEMILLRKSVWPLREVVNSLERGESPLIKESTGIFLRDVYDHTIQVMDTVEIFRDMTSGMLDLYLSSISNKMNEVMKVLTVIATLFIPTTFIVGVYGMNFEYMPELKWRYGYLLIWMVIIGVTSAMLIYFKKKKWY
jgi:magnesium transporter